LTFIFLYFGGLALVLSTLCAEGRSANRQLQ